MISSSTTGCQIRRDIPSTSRRYPSSIGVGSTNTSSCRWRTSAGGFIDCTPMVCSTSATSEQLIESYVV